MQNFRWGVLADIAKIYHPNFCILKFAEWTVGGDSPSQATLLPGPDSPLVPHQPLPIVIPI